MCWKNWCHWWKWFRSNKGRSFFFKATSPLPGNLVNAEQLFTVFDFGWENPGGEPTKNVTVKKKSVKGKQKSYFLKVSKVCFFHIDKWHSKGHLSDNFGYFFIKKLPYGSIFIFLFLIEKRMKVETQTLLLSYIACSNVFSFFLYKRLKLGKLQILEKKTYFCKKNIFFFLKVAIRFNFHCFVLNRSANESRDPGVFFELYGMF